MILVSFWIRNSLDGLAARMERISGSTTLAELAIASESIMHANSVRGEKRRA